MAKQGRTRTASEDYNQRSIERVFRLVKLMRRSPRRTPDELAEVLDVSTRTIYRYFNLIEALGFVVRRDSLGNMYIAGSELKESFTEEEADLIAELIRQHVPHHPEANSILAKLDVFSANTELESTSLQREQVNRIAALSEAIQRGEQVLLVGYQSANSQNIRDRVVEPVGFAANYSLLSGYEVRSRTTKFFRLDRMGGVELLGRAQEHTSQHQDLIPDMFGFAMAAGDEAQGHIRLNLTMKAALIMRTEYPMCIPHLRLQDAGLGFVLDGPVADFRAPARFVQGFMGSEDVEVIGSEAFVAVLNGDEEGEVSSPRA